MVVEAGYTILYSNSHHCKTTVLKSIGVDHNNVVLGAAKNNLAWSMKSLQSLLPSMYSKAVA